MTAVQMNIRIDRDLKATGDAAFEGIGYTPTEVIREVWGFARRNRHNRGALVDLMRSLRDPREIAAEDDAAAQRDAQFEEWLSRGPSIVRAYCDESGIDFDSIPSLTPAEYDELLLDDLMESFERAGEAR